LRPASGKFEALSLVDILGLVRLAAEGAQGVAGMVERMHGAILDTFGFVPLAGAVTGGVTRFVYRGVQGALQCAGEGAGAALALVDGKPDAHPVSRRRAAALAALNGVVGDHLAETGNPLALQMCFRSGGRRLALEPDALAKIFPDAPATLVVLVHGLCMSDLQWTRRNHDHGAALARDFGYAPVYLSYNTGLHVSTNGRAFAEALDRLVVAWPVEVRALLIVGHSMGGLVARSACLCGEAAGQDWRKKLRGLVFLGTPHHGAPLEQVGNWAETVLRKTPYAAALGSLGAARSAGVTDLRHGALRDEDWRDRDRFAREPDRRRPAPLPGDVACHAVAATLAAAPGSLKGRLLGDGLVPVASALGSCRDARRRLNFPPERQWIATGAGHMDLLSRSDVYAQMAKWLAPTD